MVQGYGTEADSSIDYYPCLDNMFPMDSGEIVFSIDTENSPFDTLRVEIDTSAPIFVYSDCDTDSLVTYCLWGTVCIENVIRGEQYIVIMEGPQGSMNSWDLSVNCYEYHLAGETCEDAIELTSDVSHMSVCTAGHHDDYSMTGGCGLYTPGADLVYKICLAPFSHFEASLSTECIEYISFYLFTDCNDPENSCVAGASDLIPDTLPDMIELQWDNGAVPQEVYLVIDNACDTPHSTGFGGRMELSVDFESCPPPKVCCFDDGSCLMVYLDDACYQAGGELHPEFYNCDPNPCLPIAPCCLEIVCFMSNETDCQQSGGIWHPEWSSCLPNPCLPEAVCCLGNDCFLANEPTCLQSGGIWKPELGSCDPNPCLLSAVDEPDGFRRTELFPAEPNPFFERSSIHFNLAHSGEIEIMLFDPTGRMVRHLYTGTSAAGASSIEWDGCNSNGERLDPGAYFIRMQIGGEVFSQRIVKLQ